MLIKICEECGQPFETNRSRSRWCKRKHVRICLICGKEFEVSRQQLVDNKRCCSRACSQIFAQQQEKLRVSETKKICKECGKVFIPTNANQHYCADTHYRPCPVCGKPVPVTNYGDLKSGVRRTCSSKCYRKYLSIKSSESHPQQLPKYSTCVICGREFELQWPYTQKTCSSACRGTYRKESGIAKKAYEKTKQTCMSKYGYSNPGEVPEIQRRVESTCLERYGAERVLKLKEFQDKAVETTRKHYRVDYPAQSSAVQDRMKAATYAKYGVDNYFRTREHMTSTMSDPTKADEWEMFKSDPISYIQAHFDHKPNIRELEDCLGVTDTRIYDYIVACDGQSYMSRYSSIMESEVLEFIKSLDVKCQIITHDRAQISPYELDIYLPDYRLAIECNPTITHNSTAPDQWGSKPKETKYHKMKSDLCADAGIQLFHIFGWDWKYKRNIIKSMIANKLGVSKKIYARNCTVRYATYEETKKFLDENHRQGYASYKYSICLCNTFGDIVSLMTFGKMRNSQGKKRGDENSVELLRFCNSLNLSVVGGASKLFKQFIRDHATEFSKIVSYSDVAHTSGNLYSVLGFHRVSQSEPGYVWADAQTEKYYNRVSCQKRNLRKLFNDETIDIENKTEKQIMIEHGYVQVFDSGVIRWEYECNNHI